MVIFSIEIFWITLAPSYYGLMYAIWFMVGYYIIMKRWIISGKKLEDLFMYIFLGVILWWRLWYVLFYNPMVYLQDPLSILKIWEWWMSFHGWVVGVLIAMWIFYIRKKVPFRQMVDEVCAILPIGLWAGRIWNYLNCELLWYAWYTWPFAVVQNGVSYFPSPLLEAVLEGLVLYIILLYIYKHKKFHWHVALHFLIWYWIFRMIVEIFFRTPDAHIWYIFWFLTMWEILTLPMIVVWLYYYFKLHRENSTFWWD